VERLPVCFVEGFRESCHEPTPCSGAAEFRKIDHAGERTRANQAAERCAHTLVKRHVGMPAAENYDRVTRRCAVRTGTQAPPHPERIHHANARACLQQVLDQAFRCVSLART
jgi:hypothetical protein